MSVRLRSVAHAALVLVALLVLAGPAIGCVGSPVPVATGLEAPWDVVPLPDGRLLVTERDLAQVRVIEADGALRATPVFTDATGASPQRFLGLALHPDHAQNGLVYLFQTHALADGSSRSRILQLVDQGTELTLERVILDDIPTDARHDGGRLAFGPDGKLYVTVGDAHDPSTPQDLQSLNGKVLRLEPDGSAPADNPFAAEGGNARYVWSYGHRHPQGLAWDAAGRLWATEHGPSGEPYAPAGADFGRDELNLVVPGGNYGWPLVAGEQRAEGTIAPVVHSGDDTWAPAGLAFAADGRLYAPALRGRHLREFRLSGDAVVGQAELFRDVFGRLRTATATPAALYLTTDEPDGSVLRAPIEAEGLRPGHRAAPASTTDP